VDGADGAGAAAGAGDEIGADALAKDADGMDAAAVCPRRMLASSFRSERRVWMTSRL
jgi:hypothetical protein